MHNIGRGIGGIREGEGEGDGRAEREGEMGLTLGEGLALGDGLVETGLASTLHSHVFYFEPYLKI